MFTFNKRKYKQLSDTDLIVSYKEKHDQYIIGILYERYGHLVMGSCIHYLKDEYEAEEITSKIFEELPGKLIKYNIVSFKSWLYQLTRNECLQFLRKTPFPVSPFNHETIFSAQPANDIPDIEAKLIKLEEMLKQLHEPQQSSIRLFYIEDKSYTEISTLLGIELKTVKSSIQNGKRNLKIMLSQQDEFNYE